MKTITDKLAALQDQIQTLEAERERVERHYHEIITEFQKGDRVILHFPDTKLVQYGRVKDYHWNGSLCYMVEVTRYSIKKKESFVKRIINKLTS